MRIIPRRNIAGYPGELADILGLLVRGRIKDGPYVKQFEDNFARYIGTKHAVAAASGRSGLFLILDALSLDKNDEVLLPAYTDESVPATIRSLGLVPVFIDIDKDTHNIDAGSIEKKINARTRVVIATHIFGRPCDLARISAIAQKRGLIVIEDCAHAIGAEYHGRRAGSFGRAAYFSFGISKPLNTFGGGMVTTDDSVLYARIVAGVARFDYPGNITTFKNIVISYCLFFLTRPLLFSVTLFPLLLAASVFNKDLIGLYNRTVKQAIKWGDIKVRLTNVQALAGLKQLQGCDEANKRRKRNAALFMQSLDKRIAVLRDDPAAVPTYYFFVILVPDAASLAKRLLFKGIDTGKHIMRDCAAMVNGDAGCAAAGEAVRMSLQIPNHPQLGQQDAAYVAGVLNQIVKADPAYAENIR